MLTLLYNFIKCEKQRKQTDDEIITSIAEMMEENDDFTFDLILPVSTDFDNGYSTKGDGFCNYRSISQLILKAVDNSEKYALSNWKKLDADFNDKRQRELFIKNMTILLENMELNKGVKHGDWGKNVHEEDQIMFIERLKGMLKDLNSMYVTKTKSIKILDQDKWGSTSTICSTFVIDPVTKIPTGKTLFPFVFLTKQSNHNNVIGNGYLSNQTINALLEKADKGKISYHKMIHSSLSLDPKYIDKHYCKGCLETAYPISFWLDLMYKYSNNCLVQEQNHFYCASLKCIGNPKTMIQELLKKIASQFFSILTKVITDIEHNNNIINNYNKANNTNNNNSDNESLKTEFKMDSELIRKDSIIFEKSLTIIALTEILLENKLKFPQSLLPPIELEN